MPDKNENPTDTIARLEAELAQLRADYNTLKRNYERLQHTVKASNPFGAGRKFAYTERQNEIMQYHRKGYTIVAISDMTHIPQATVARYIRRAKATQVSSKEDK